MTTVITLMWGSAWERYGETFAASFHRHWPAPVRLIVVSDGDRPLPRGEIVPLGEVDGHAEFIARWRDVPRANGFDRPPGSKVDSNGYSWRHDAVKWAAQAMAPHRVVRDLPDGEIVCCLDADVVTFADVPANLIESLLAGRDLCYLGRAPKHSEIGFWAVRLSAASRNFIEDYAEMYRSDAVFRLQEWHSAFVFDRARERSEVWGLESRDLTPGGRGHVWFASPLREFMDHLKGERKARGRSKERTQ